MILYMTLSCCSFIYLILSGYMDLKERMIYGMPAMILSIGWGIFMGLSQMWSLSFLICYWSVHIALYVLFNWMHLWGAGDSDVFVLFGNLCLIAAGESSTYHIILMECVGLILAMAISIGICAVEFKVKHLQFEMKGKAAVVPGFAIIMILLIIKGFIWRYM